MTDIDTILNSVAPDPVRPDSGVVDADLARGRAALATARRRRVLRGAGAGGAALAIAAVVVVVATSSGSNSPAAHAATSGPHIQLVDYAGAQLNGFKVTEIPQGWHLSTSTSDALLITPDDGSAGDNPDVFVGKLAVLVQSDDQHGLGPGDPMTVDGQPARYQANAGGGVAMLTYATAAGQGINIQVPLVLHWTPDQVAAFAAGVTVEGTLGHTHG